MSPGRPSEGLLDGELRFPLSRAKAFLALLISLALAGFGLMLVPERPLLGWAAFVVFALGAAAALKMLTSDEYYLRLTREGFEVAGLLRQREFRWSEIEPVQVGSLRGFRFLTVTPRSRGRIVLLGNFYTTSIDDIQATMNAWRKHYGRLDHGPRTRAQQEGGNGLL